MSKAEMDAIQEEVDECENHLTNMFKQSKSSGQSPCQIDEDFCKKDRDIVIRQITNNYVVHKNGVVLHSQVCEPTLMSSRTQDGPRVFEKVDSYYNPQ